MNEKPQQWLSKLFSLTFPLFVLHASYTLIFITWGLYIVYLIIKRNKVKNTKKKPSKTKNNQQKLGNNRFSITHMKSDARARATRVELRGTCLIFYPRQKLLRSPRIAHPIFLTHTWFIFFMILDLVRVKKMPTYIFVHVVF